MDPTFDPCLHASRCHVWHNTRWHQLLHHGGHPSAGDSLWMCRLCLHPFPPPPKAEKAAGRPTGRRHQQPEGVRQPNQERGPSRPPPAAGCPARAASSPCSRLTLLWGDWTDPAAFPSPLTLLTSTKACPCSQTGHFKPGQGEIEPLQLHRQPRTGGLTLELLDVWGVVFFLFYFILRPSHSFAHRSLSPNTAAISQLWLWKWKDPLASVCSRAHWHMPERQRQGSTVLSLFWQLWWAVGAWCLTKRLFRLLNWPGDLKTCLGVPETLSRGSRGSFSIGASQHVPWSMMPCDWCSEIFFWFRLNSDRLTEWAMNGCLFNTQCVSVSGCSLVSVWEWKRKCECILWVCVGGKVTQKHFT